MTLQSITWAKSIVDTLFSKFSEPILANMSKCERVRGMLADEESKEAYVQELSYKILVQILGNSSSATNLVGGMTLEKFQQDLQRASTDQSLPKIEVEGNAAKLTLLHSLVCTYYYGQYQYKEIMPKANDVVLDCGACFGETSLWFLKHGASKVFAFEIDPGNLPILERTVANTPCTIIKQALGKERSTLWYTSNPTNPGAGIVSSTKRENSTVVPVATIDSFCRENDVTPTFIKMDLEGSEFDTLLGAEWVITTYKPRLAVCLYHKIEDMWRIPLLLKKYNEGYTFYCKKNHPFCEFVLYGIV